LTRVTVGKTSFFEYLLTEKHQCQKTMYKKLHDNIVFTIVQGLAGVAGDRMANRTVAY